MCIRDRPIAHRARARLARHAPGLVRARLPVRGQPGEALAVFRARAQFVAERWGRAGPLGAEDEARAQALSVAWANYQFLGCRYPKEIEAEAGCGARVQSAVSI